MLSRISVITTHYRDKRTGETTLMYFYRILLSNVSERESEINRIYLLFFLFLIVLSFITITSYSFLQTILCSRPRTTPSAISGTELSLTRVVDVRSSEYHLENILINFGKERHAHSCLAPNYQFRDLTLYTA